MATDTYSRVKAVMDKYGIPTWLWYPAMMVESGGKADSVTTNGGLEYSVGLFQINRKAHPEYNYLDLTNVETNAEVAARDFLKPGLTTAKAITTDQKLQAEIAYSGLKNPTNTTSSNKSFISGGIKPQWTAELKKSFDNYFNTASGTSSSSTNDTYLDESGNITYNKAIGPTQSSSSSLNTMESWFKTILVVAVAIVGVIAVFKLAGMPLTASVPSLSKAPKEVIE